MIARATELVASASAVLLALSGLLLLSAPDESGALLGIGASGRLAVSLWGSGLLGFAAMNWISRRSLLGGIYGRAVVVANQTHFTIGSLLLIRPCLAS